MNTTSNKAATLIGCLGMLAVCAACVSALTSGFEHWTFEDRRIAMAQRGELRSGRMDMVTSAGDVQNPWPGAGRGRIYVVDFIYTRCPLVCQVLGSEYQRMQDILRVRLPAGVQLLSISFDTRDKVPDLLDYGARFRADPTLWTVAAPRHPAHTERLLKDFGVVVLPDGSGGYVHNAAIHLVNGEGELVGIFPYEEWEAAIESAARYVGHAARTSSRGTG